jgi:hypothetical protein
MTGRLDGAPNHVAGTVPDIGPPGEPKDGIAPRVVATSVESDTAGPTWLDEDGLVGLVAGGPLVVVLGAVGAIVDPGRGAAAFPSDELHAGISTPIANAIRAATKYWRLTSPKPAERRS